MPALALWDVRALANPRWPRALSRQRPAWRPVPTRRRRAATVSPPRSASDDRRSASRRADLLDSAAAEARLTRLSPNRAIEAVLSHRHRPHVPDLLGMRAKALLDCIGLARSIPVYAWRRPNAMLETGLDDAALLVRAL